MADLTLLDVNNKLLETEDAIQSKLPQYIRAEIAYSSKYNDFLLHSGMGSAPLREAEARQRMQIEDETEKYLSTKLEYRLLQSRKETLIEVSRNLRSYAYGT